MGVIQIGTASRALLGEDARQNLPELLGDQAGARLLVVASASSLRRGPVAELVAALRSVAPVETWTEVQPNPRIADIDACCTIHAEAGITHVIGIGGGSALDQAKATALSLSCRRKVGELLASKTHLPQRANQLILLPTTSGTGAELSYGAILTDGQNGQKVSLRGANLAADLALVDPVLSYSVPVDVTMVTGFDVLTHALETWVSNAATIYTADLSRAALERVFRWLPVLKDDASHVVARREMAYASMTMGHTLALSTTCLPHRLQYPVGAATDTAHAAGLAALYPAWMAHVLPFATEKLAQCAVWIGAAPSGADPREKARAFITAVNRLLARIELQPTLQDLGVTAEMVARFPGEVSGKLDADPGYRGPADLASIYDAAFRPDSLQKGET